MTEFKSREELEQQIDKLTTLQLFDDLTKAEQDELDDCIEAYKRYENQTGQT